MYRLIVALLLAAGCAKPKAKDAGPSVTTPEQMPVWTPTFYFTCLGTMKPDGIGGCRVGDEFDRMHGTQVSPWPPDDAGYYYLFSDAGPCWGVCPLTEPNCCLREAFTIYPQYGTLTTAGGEVAWTHDNWHHYRLSVHGCTPVDAGMWDCCGEYLSDGGCR
jgi:hypothetical protein